MSDYRVGSSGGSQSPASVWPQSPSVGTIRSKAAQPPAFVTRDNFEQAPRSATRLSLEGEVPRLSPATTGRGGRFTIGEVLRTGGVAPWAPQVDRGQIDTLVREGYAKKLMREPDAGGAAQWGDKLEAMARAGASPEALAAALEEGLATSQEGQVLAAVASQFQSELGRTPESKGYWHEQALSWAGQGVPMEEIQARLQQGLHGSAERALAHPEEFLEATYQRLLGRSADGEGVAAFSQKMRELNAQGASWEDIQRAVEKDIQASPEYAARQQPTSPPGTSGGTQGTSGTPAPSSIPGAEKAISYAENPGINPNTGTNEWAYWCLALVNRAYGGGTNGMLRAETATGAFNNYQNAGRIQQGDNPPRGAVVFFDYTGKDGVDYGHVGISLGDGTYIGTTTDGTNTGVRPIHGSLPYKGWAVP